MPTGPAVRSRKVGRSHTLRPTPYRSIRPAHRVGALVPERRPRGGYRQDMARQRSLTLNLLRAVDRTESPRDRIFARPRLWSAGARRSQGGLGPIGGLTPRSSTRSAHRRHPEPPQATATPRDHPTQELANFPRITRSTGLANSHVRADHQRRIGHLKADPTAPPTPPGSTGLAAEPTTSPTAHGHAGQPSTVALKARRR
jgi:hypothetical protein